MADGFSLEPSGFVREFGKWILRMLERVTGERTKGLDLAGCREPPAGRGAGMTPPAFDREGQVRGPKREGLEHAHQHMLARIQQLHQAVEAGQTAGRRIAYGIEGRAQV